MRKDALPLQQPKPIWHKPIKVDWTQFTKALTKMAGHAARASISVEGKLDPRHWAGIVSEFGELLTAFSLETTPEERAWILVQNALKRGMTTLTIESANSYRWNAEGLEGKTKEYDLATHLKDIEYGITQDFFKKPKDLPFLPKVEHGFALWLQYYGLSEAESKNVARRLPAYFVYALQQEWRDKPADYAPISDALSTPFADAASAEAHWELYYARLLQQFAEPLFDETFCLADVFVWQHAYYKEQPRANSDYEAAPKQINCVVDLHTELKGWLATPQSSGALRVIAGDPGAGKSSCLKMFVQEVIDQNLMKVVFVPLHRLKNLKGELQAEVTQYLRDYEGFKSDPFEGDNPLLLLLDGLDELDMQGGEAQKIAEDFVTEVIRTLDKKPHLFVLLTGRTIAVQSASGSLRNLRQTLHLLPYHFTEKQRQEYDYSKTSYQDFRPEWWEKYRQAKGELRFEAKEILQNQALDDITSQPLLNYLLATALESGRLQISNAINRNQIYQELLEEVYERRWGKAHSASQKSEEEPTAGHTTLQGLKLDDFKRILETIALAIWHGNGKTATLSNIARYCEEAKYNEQFDAFRADAKKGAVSLMLSFFFRQEGVAENDKTFEFTHKTFGEYLIAKRIVRAIDRICKQRKAKQEDRDTGWEIEEAVKHWMEVCAPAPLDTYLLQFLRDEVSLNAAHASNWQEVACEMLNYTISQNMPMTWFASCKNFRIAALNARNAEETLLAVHSACALNTQKVSTLQWGIPIEEWLHRLTPSQQPVPIAFQCLNHLDLQGAYLRGADLQNANLQNANLQGANLQFANLQRANLQFANLQRANLQNASLQRANLQDANLQRANLEEAYLQYAYLQRAHLEEADLQGAYLQYAYLQFANLEGANLQDAKNVETIRGLSPEEKEELIRLAQMLPDKEEAP